MRRGNIMKLVLLAGPDNEKNEAHMVAPCAGRIENIRMMVRYPLSTNVYFFYYFGKGLGTDMLEKLSNTEDLDLDAFPELRDAVWIRNTMLDSAITEISEERHVKTKYRKKPIYVKKGDNLSILSNHAGIGEISNQYVIVWGDFIPKKGSTIELNIRWRLNTVDIDYDKGFKIPFSCYAERAEVIWHARDDAVSMGNFKVKLVKGAPHLTPLHDDYTNTYGEIQTDDTVDLRGQRLGGNDIIYCPINAEGTSGGSGVHQERLDRGFAQGDLLLPDYEVVDGTFPSETLDVEIKLHGTITYSGYVKGGTYLKGTGLIDLDGVLQEVL